MESVMNMLCDGNNKSDSNGGDDLLNAEWIEYFVIKFF